MIQVTKEEAISMVELLDEGMDRIREESWWTQHAMAKNRFGAIVNPFDCSAVAFCPQASIMVACKVINHRILPETYANLIHWLDDACMFNFGKHFNQWNDTHGVTHVMVMDFLNRSRDLLNIYAGKPSTRNA